ncbi:MAG: ABC transporter substrate-binding protein [Firmicutes bacterium]|nr:ABC transporter substrate-binding protein [Bacillota bacterium]
MKKRILAIILASITAVSMCFMMTGCGGSSEEGKTLNIMQQYGLAYAPFQIMEAQGLIEAAYEEATGETVTVTYSELNSGSTINESFAAGDVQVGAMGIAPAITGSLSGVGYKICSNMSAQPHKLMTQPDSGIKTLADFKGEDQIALVANGSFQHILLAMACNEQLGDAHALDNNILQASHPEGKMALENNQVAAQLTSSPFTFQEEAEGMVEVEAADGKGAIESVWPEGNSFIVAVAAESLYNDDPEMYNAVTTAIAQAVDFINENPEEAAQILIDNDDSVEEDVETVVSWFNDPACSYFTELKGVMDMASFMAKEGFLEVDGPSSISDLAYDNVKGE